MDEEKIFGTDLGLGFLYDDAGIVRADPCMNVDMQAALRSDVLHRTFDLGVIGGKANLAQALIMRLMTERGELSRLGHPEYGSRHHSLVGELNTENNRSLLKLYLIECLRQEPRLEEILKVDVRQGANRESMDKVFVDIDVVMKGYPDPLNLVVPFSFEGVE